MEKEKSLTQSTIMKAMDWAYDKAINGISGFDSAATVRQINQKVGFKLFTKFGEKGIINFGKAVPLLGGVVGGLFDVIATNTVGNVAIDTFLPKK